MAKKRGQSKYQSLLDKIQGMDLGGGGFWKPQVGLSTIRILPAVQSMEFFFTEVGRHYTQRQYCLAISTDGEDECPICTINERLFQSGEREAASKFRASRAFWVNIIDRSAEGQGVQIYTPGIRVFQNLSALISDPDFGDITDEDDGFDIKITREGMGRDDTKYTVMPTRNPSSLSRDDDTLVEWLESATDLNARIEESLLDWDALIEAAGIQAWFDDDGEMIDEFPDDDDDDDDDVGEDTEEVEEPATRRRRRRSRRR